MLLGEWIRRDYVRKRLLIEGALMPTHQPSQPPSPPPPPLLPLLPADRESWLRHTRLYFLLTLLYFAGNNITFVVLQGISSTTNLVISQVKLLFTVILLSAMMRRRFNLQQVMALVVLGAALVLEAHEEIESQRLGIMREDTFDTVNTSSAEGDTLLHKNVFSISPIVGILLSVLTAFTGALAGVFNEKFLKELKSTIYLQSMLMYLWGCGFNLVWVFIEPTSREIVLRGGFLSGYNRWAWGYVFFQAMMGLSVAFIFKYMDNLARTLAVGTSTACTIVLSIPIFGQEVSLSSGCAIFVIFCAVLAYYDGGMRGASEKRIAGTLKATTDEAPDAQSPVTTQCANVSQLKANQEVDHQSARSKPEESTPLL
jgi:hypothetical protein